MVLSKVKIPKEADHFRRHKLVLEKLRERVKLISEGEIARLWQDHVKRIDLPTTPKWEKQQKRTPAQQRAAIGDEAKEAADSCNIKAGNMALAAGVTAPPGERELTLLRGLVPERAGLPSGEMRRWYDELGYHKPNERVMLMYARLGSDHGEESKYNEVGERLPVGQDA